MKREDYLRRIFQLVVMIDQQVYQEKLKQKKYRKEEEHVLIHVILAVL